MYVGTFLLSPISPVLVDVFLGSRRARAQTSKSAPTKYSSLPVRPATTGPQPTTVKFSHAYYCLTQELKVPPFNRSARGAGVPEDLAARINQCTEASIRADLVHCVLL